MVSTCYHRTTCPTQSLAEASWDGIMGNRGGPGEGALPSCNLGFLAKSAALFTVFQLPPWWALLSGHCALGPCNPHMLGSLGYVTGWEGPGL